MRLTLVFALALFSAGEVSAQVLDEVVRPEPRPVSAAQDPQPESSTARPDVAGAQTSAEEAPTADPRGMSRAGAPMSEPPELAIAVDEWAGDRPPLRPVAEAPAPGLASSTKRPQARPRAMGGPDPLPPATPDAAPALAGLDATTLAPASALMPQIRPSTVTEEAQEVSAEAVRGQVCDDPSIQGQRVPAIGDGGGCGIDEPVRISSIDGVQLSEASLMDCTTASALLDWVQTGARPAIGTRGGGLIGLDIMGSYTCRPRNGQAGAPLSEHGKGHAVDIGGFALADGSHINVLRDWPDEALGRMHDAACGPFSTVLGPEANAQHRNHFHFDTARGRGPYCR